MRRNQRYFFVYILSNFKRNVLYIGITSNILRRVYEHKQELIDGFTKQYHIQDLVYFEVFDDPKVAITREKQLKGWSRKKKNALIAKTNPILKDLYSTLI